MQSELAPQQGSFPQIPENTTLEIENTASREVAPNEASLLAPIELVHDIGKAELDVSLQNERLSSSIEEILADKAESLGLSKDETAQILADGEFTAKDLALQEQGISLCDRMLQKLEGATRVAATAIMLGITVPANAEEPIPTLASVEHQSYSLSKESAPITYEEAKRQLRSSTITSPVEKMAIFVRTKDGEPMKTLVFKTGTSVSVELNREEIDQFIESLNSRTSDIEFVHTHPLHAQEKLQLISKEKAEEVRRGETPPVSTEPSMQDWSNVFSVDEIYNFPPGQISHRVIDATGEWEFGASDSASPFIRGMRKMQSEVNKINWSETLDENERLSLRNFIDAHETPFQAVQEILSGEGSKVAPSTVEKLKNILAQLLEKHVSIIDSAKYLELVNPLSTAMNATERNDRVLRMKLIASDLGLRLNYTPHLEEKMNKDE